jgi:small subunit ribosomal protein S16
MPITVRLLRLGKKHYPFYRIVAIDKRKKRNGVYVDRLGFYDPMKKPFILDIDEKKLEFWREKGAIISEGMRKLLKKKSNLKKD